MVAPLLIAGQWRAADDCTGSFRAIDPSSGQAIGIAFPRSGAADVEQALAAASAAALLLAAVEPTRIAAFLEGYAAALEADVEALVALAHAETGLPAATRLRGNELPRTCNQLRLAARAASPGRSRAARFRRASRSPRRARSPARRRRAAPRTSPCARRMARAAPRRAPSRSRSTFRLPSPWARRADRADRTPCLAAPSALLTARCSPPAAGRRP